MPSAAPEARSRHGAARQRQRRQGGFESGGHARVRRDYWREALAEDAALTRAVVAEELAGLQVRDHPPALHRQVAYAALIARMQPTGYDTAFRAGATVSGSCQRQAVPSRQALHAATHHKTLVW